MESEILKSEILHHYFPDDLGKLKVLYIFVVFSFTSVILEQNYGLFGLFSCVYFITVSFLITFMKKCHDRIQNFEIPKVCEKA